MCKACEIMTLSILINFQDCAFYQNFEEKVWANLPIQIDLFAIYQIKHENIFKRFGTSNIEDNSNLTHKILLTIAFHSQ